MDKASYVFMKHAGNVKNLWFTRLAQFAACELIKSKNQRVVNRVAIITEMSSLNK